MAPETDPIDPGPAWPEPGTSEAEAFGGAGEPPPVAARPAKSREQPPVRLREIVGVVLLVVLADVTIYRGLGFAGYAMFFLAAPVLFVLGAPRPRFQTGFWILGLMLLVLSAKMAWCGSWLLVGAGFVLWVAFAMALAGLAPHALEVAVYASQTVLAGYEGLILYRN